MWQTLYPLLFFETYECKASLLGAAIPAPQYRPLSGEEWMGGRAILRSSG